MAKLYPPTISGPLNAFYDDVITIPVIQNKTISDAEFDGYALVFRNSSTGNLIQMQNEVSYLLSDGKTPTFTIPSGKLVEGQYYKIQIAYYKQEGLKINIGYYSSVELIKYTSLPHLAFDKGQEMILHVDYSTTDITEKQYEYRFRIYSQNNELLLDTDFQLHNRDGDEIEIVDGGKVLQSFDEYEIIYDLEESQAYRVIYDCITVNGIQISTEYEIYGVTKAPNEAFDSGDITLRAEPDLDNGCVDIYMDVIGNYSGDHYLIKRAREDEPAGAWKTIATFTNSRGGLVYRDTTIESGVRYIYALQTYNSHGIVSEMLLSNYVSVALDYTYLTDGKRQLKLIYNPKVSSFKNDIQESKTDAIGSKYPYIFRNGIIKYKEFPISALISYSSDEDDLFTIKNLPDFDERTNTPHSLLDEPAYDEYKRELDFKLEAMEWLSNGEPKLFRSPTEGNYLVRLLNVSLSPEDKLGRRLHSFTCTAYEIDDTSYKSLLNYNIYDITLDTTICYMEEQRVVESDLASLVNAGARIYNEPLGIYITGANPEAKIMIINKDTPNAPIDVIIGHTHAYTLQPTDASIIGFEVKDATAGTIKYTYKDRYTTDFEKIISVHKDIDCSVGYFSIDEGRLDIIKALSEQNGNTSKSVKNIYKLQLFRKINYYQSHFDKEKDFISFIDGTPIDIYDLDYYEVDNLTNVKSIIIPNGVEAFICYKRVEMVKEGV